MSILYQLRPSPWKHTVYHFLARNVLQDERCVHMMNMHHFGSCHVTRAVPVIGPSSALYTQMTVSGGDGSRRFMRTERKTSGDKTKQITQRSPGQGEVTIGKKVVQAGKDVSYMGVVLVGIGVTAIMFYAIGRELFASSSPNAVYTKAYKLCKKDPEIIEELGEPIKGFGETTRRGRRRHVSHLEYDQDGVKHMRMKFYIQGPKRKGTVHLEVKEDERGRYGYRYLFAELEGYPHRTIVLEDNR